MCTVTNVERPALPARRFTLLSSPLLSGPFKFTIDRGDASANVRVLASSRRSLISLISLIRDNFTEGAARATLGMRCNRPLYFPPTPTPHPLPPSVTSRASGTGGAAVSAAFVVIPREREREPCTKPRSVAAYTRYALARDNRLALRCELLPAGVTKRRRVANSFLARLSRAAAPQWRFLNRGNNMRELAVVCASAPFNEMHNVPDYR
jgi:hypothetical protein